MIGKTNSQVGGGIKGEKVNISLLTNQSEHSALMGAAITVKYGESETQYVWEGVGITVTIPPYEDYEVSVSGVAGYKTPEVFTATAQADNARSLNFEYKAERVKVTLSAVGGADMNGTTVNIYGQEYTFSGTPIEVLVPFDEVYSVQGGAFGSLVAPLAQSFTASIPLREINLEYRSCVLVVNMLSNQVSDATIAALKASVKYGSTTIEVANGVMVDIPSGTDITITFPDVPDYKTPEPITFTHTSGYSEKTGTYLTEKVTVDVSANDDVSVDGQVVTVAKRALVEYTPENGVYIQSVDGMLYTEAEWDSSKVANGIAVVTDACRFVMALSDISGTSGKRRWGGYGILVSGITSTDTDTLEDYNGEYNTTQIINQLKGQTDSKGTTGAPAAEACRAFVFPNGQVGYLPAFKELRTAFDYRAAINTALSKCGGTNMVAKTGEGTYWTSSQSSANSSRYQSWYGNGTSSTVSKDSSYYVRAFTTLTAIKEGTSDETHEVTNGEVTFKVAHGTDYTVSVDSKDSYKTPASVTHTASESSRTIPMVYQTETVTVNVGSNDGEVSGFEVSIIKGELVGDSDSYTRLDYIESTGTQYIDTGFKPNQDTRVVMDVQLTASPTDVGNIFGSRTSATSNNFAFNYSTTSAAFLSDFADYTKSRLNFSFDALTRLSIDSNKTSITVNGTQQEHVLTAFQGAYNLCLLALNNAGTVQWYSKAKLYACQIYDNDTLVRDYVPVLRSDGVAGLFDLVNQKFYASSGSGNFVAGVTVADGEKELVATQTTASGTYKIPFGESYILLAGKVDGYEAPATKAFIASQDNRTVDLQYLTERVTVNVSSNDNAISGFEVSVVKNEMLGNATKYTRLAYIESTGTQYVDTGFKPNQDTRVVMDFENKGNYSGMTIGLCPFFGARNGSSSAVYALWIGATSYPHYGDVAYNKNGSFSIDINTRLVYDFNKNVVSIGDASITCSTSTFSTNYNLCLLTINNYGTIESRKASGKLYSCKVYDNDTIIRDYIPALRADGIAGLYDAVHDKFYPSNGTGNFVSGGEYKEVLGTQTSVTGTYKVPFGDSYSVVANDTEDYKASAPQTFIASQDNRVVNVLYQTENVTVNVSSDDGNVSGYNVTVSKCDMVGKSTKYARLEYIESTGTQRINTGFIPNQDTRVVVRAYYPQVSSTTCLFGARQADAKLMYMFASSSKYYRSDYNTTHINVTNAINGDITVDMNKNVTTVNGEYVATHTYAEFTSPVPLYLFDSNSNGTAFAPAKAKMYYCQIYDNGILVRDYYPALRSDGVAGMYDAVNDTFSPSSGSGNFVAGNEIVEVLATQTSATATYKIPFGEGCSISANAVDGYTAPATQTFIASQDSRVVSVEYIVAKSENCTVNVTGLSSGFTITGKAEDGTVLFTQTSALATHEIDAGTKYYVTASDVDGYSHTADTEMFTAVANNNRTVNIAYKVHTGTKNPTNGVWIQDTDGYCHKESEWTGEYTANGVAVVTSNCRFVVGLKSVRHPWYDDRHNVEDDLWWGEPESGTMVTTSSSTAATDFNGEENTENLSGVFEPEIITVVKSMLFKNGKAGYLPAAGEVLALVNNRSSVLSAMRKCGGSTYGIESGAYKIASSTQYDTHYHWAGGASSLEKILKKWTVEGWEEPLSSCYVRPFQSL